MIFGVVSQVDPSISTWLGLASQFGFAGLNLVVVYAFLQYMQKMDEKRDARLSDLLRQLSGDRDQDVDRLTEVIRDNTQAMREFSMMARSEPSHRTPRSRDG